MAYRDFDENEAREITEKKKKGYIITRDGSDARIICWDAKGKRPIVALIDRFKEERVARYTLNGRHDERDNVTSNLDLVIEEESALTRMLNEKFNEIHADLIKSNPKHAEELRVEFFCGVAAYCHLTSPASEEWRKQHGETKE